MILGTPLITSRQSYVRSKITTKTQEQGVKS